MEKGNERKIHGEDEEEKGEGTKRRQDEEKSEEPTRSI